MCFSLAPNWTKKVWFISLALFHCTARNFFCSLLIFLTSFFSPWHWSPLKCFSRNHNLRFDFELLKVLRFQFTLFVGNRWNIVNKNLPLEGRQKFLWLAWFRKLWPQLKRNDCFVLFPRHNWKSERCSRLLNDPWAKSLFRVSSDNIGSAWTYRGLWQLAPIALGCKSSSWTGTLLDVTLWVCLLVTMLVTARLLKWSPGVQWLPIRGLRCWMSRKLGYHKEETHGWEDCGFESCIRYFFSESPLN